MRFAATRFCVLLAAAGVLTLPANSETQSGPSAPNFRLQDYTGAWHELYDFAGKKAVVLIVHGNGCPIVRQSYPHVDALFDEYGSKEAVFLYINANNFDTRESVRDEAAEFKVRVPVLLDENQALARILSFDRTAETFVIDPKTWTIVYRGMADDRFDYGLQRPNPRHFWLRDALDALLKGERPAYSVTEAKGCLLDLKPLPADVEFSADVLFILKKRLPDCAGPLQRWTVSPELAREAVRDLLLLQRVSSLSCASTDNAIELNDSEAELLLAWLMENIERN
jgi:peroxiredoxin